MNGNNKDIENAQLTTDDFDGTNRSYDEMTEGEVKEATDAVQVRHLIKINERGEVRNRDDVTLKFEMKVGVKDTGFDLNDTRRVLKLYKIPDGYWYRLDDEVNGRSDVSDNLPPHKDLAQDSIGFVEHAVNKEGCNVDESYEFIKIDCDIEDYCCDIEDYILMYADV